MLHREQESGVPRPRGGPGAIRPLTINVEIKIQLRKIAEAITAGRLGGTLIRSFMQFHSLQGIIEPASITVLPGGWLCPSRGSRERTTCPSQTNPPSHLSSVMLLWGNATAASGPVTWTLSGPPRDPEASGAPEAVSDPRARRRPLGGI